MSTSVKLLSTSDGIYRYRLHGRVEELPLRPNHFFTGEVGGGISSLSYPEVTGRGVRRLTYEFRGETWVAIYRREDGRWAQVGSYTIAKVVTP